MMMKGIPRLIRSISSSSLLNEKKRTKTKTKPKPKDVALVSKEEFEADVRELLEGRNLLSESEVKRFEDWMQRCEPGERRKFMVSLKMKSDGFCI